MKKNKAFLLTTLVSLLPLLLVMPLLLINNINSVFNYVDVLHYYKLYAYYVYLISNGLSAFDIFILGLVLPLTIIISLIFLLVSKKKEKLIIPAYIFTGLSLLVAIVAVLFFSFIKIGTEVFDYVNYLIQRGGVYSMDSIYTSMIIGMYVVGFVIFSFVALPSLIMFVLSLVFAKERKKKEEQIEEQPVEQLEEEPKQE